MTLPFQLTDANWLSFSINGEDWAIRQSPFDKFTVKLNFARNHVARYPSPRSFVDEVHAGAERLVKNLVEPNDRQLKVFYSGGIDSEIALRALHRVKDRPSLLPIILHYSNGHNDAEVEAALRTCDELELKPYVVDHDMEHFVDSGRAYELALRYECSQLAYLSVLHHADVLGPYLMVMGGEILFQKHWVSGEGKWYYVYREDEDAATYRFSQFHGRPLVNEFFSYTPEMFLAWFEHPAVQEVFHNPYKLSMISSKNALLKELYFDPLGLTPNATVKKHGFENMLVLNEQVQAQIRGLFPPMQEFRIPISQLQRTL